MKFAFGIFLYAAGMGLAIALPMQAQITAAPDGTNTIVTPGGSSLNITGGTQTGTSLFHSFQQFGLNAGQTANFDLTSTGTVQNILGRVVGGNASVINGIIQVTGSNANLYLMNPAGMIFGAGASLNVNGSFTATTANGIGLGGQWFNATGSNDYASLTGTPDRLGFTMAQPGAIVNAGNLVVGAQQTLLLVGGTVVSTTPLNTPGRGIAIATVPGSSLVRISQPGSPLSLEVQAIALAPSTPNSLPSSFTIPSLPQLLTGGSAGNAHGLTVNSSGQVTLTGSGLAVQPGAVVASDTINNAGIPPGIGSDPNIASVQIVAARDIAVDDIQTRGRSVQLVAGGNIATGTVGTGGIDNAFNSGIILVAPGNIQVSTLDAGNGGINVQAGGTFQALGSFSTAFFDIRVNNPSLIDYLSSLGYPRDQLIARGVPSRTGSLPVSLIARPRGGLPTITIRTGDASQTIAATSRVNIQVDSRISFVLGPAFPNDLVFVPQNPVNNVNPFNPVTNPNGFNPSSPFLFTTQNGTALTFPSSVFPANASGTVGAVVIGGGGDAGLSTSFQNRSFAPTGTSSGGGTLNTLQNQVSSADGQTVQRQLIGQTQNAACAPATAIARVPDGVSTRSPNTSDRNLSASASGTPCLPVGNDEQILQLLEPVTPKQP